MGKTGVVTRPIVDVTDFRKSYGRTRAVDGVSFSVMPGEIYGLIGPDGSGKSSIMKAVAGVLSFESGSVTVFGQRLVSESAAELIKQRCGFMPQGLGLNLYPDLSIEENIDFFARLRLVPRQKLKQTKSQLLAMTRLEPFRSRPMKKLSGGMKQKLGLVCTLIHEPDLIILDEPTTGVDPVSRRDFWKILSSLLREKGITAIVSTAYMDEASRFHHLSLFHQGKILARGDMESITGKAGGAMVIFKTPDQQAALSKLAGPPFMAQASGEWIRAYSPNQNQEAIDHVAQVLEGAPVFEAYLQKPNLEEASIHLLSDQDGLGLEAFAEAEENEPRAVYPPGGPINVIQASNLVRKFGDFTAVDHVSFSVKKGEIFGLVGANGAGKTTVIKMLTGIMPPTEGHGKVAGGDMKRAARYIKQNIGYVSQAFSLYQELSVRENLRLYGAIYGLQPLKARRRANELAAMMGLGAYMDKQAGDLPMGLRQRLALGCALVHRPTILFLDEPTSGVDPLGRKRFWEILHKLARVDGVTILITTHYMSEVENCDHVVIMHAGRVVADDSPEQLKKDTQARAGEMLEVHTDQPLRTLGLLEDYGFDGVGLFGKKVHLLAKDPAAAEKAIRTLTANSGALLYSIEPMPLGMEDVFVCQVLSLEKASREAA
ncbi:ABC transporter related [Desulfatibacillum aliphaticivorans]|uniref:ABC transporter related n=1 Tax=Desulfatibacillum aliphaticivorans TaxID=218208 RepID=B8FDU2_DESAL|nr:ATP-binding cassette domain-containing protein [Desulfatibacillum aliphaticivorans]ACL06723.1 ABC transporter related [Desulfatibacillum aliphaticivorans]